MQVLPRHFNRLLLAAIAAMPLLFAVAPAIAVPSEGVSSDLDRTATTTPEQKLEYASTSVTEIEDAVKTIERLLQQTTEKKDADADSVQCLKNRLTSVRALAQVAASSKTALSTAVNEANEEVANHEYRKIAVVLGKTRVLLAEANQCATGSDVESGTTLVDWISDLRDGSTLTTAEIDDLDLGIFPPPVTTFK